jgi:protein O-mannosyl-transferase
MKLSKAEKKRLRREQHLNKILKKPEESATVVSFKPDSLLTIKKYVETNLYFILLLLVVTFTAYFYILFGDFVTADDYAGILNNEAMTSLASMVKTLRIAGILKSLTYTIFGFNPFFFHLGSLALHMFMVLLFFVFASMLFDKKAAAVASFLFATHPVNSEAVSWISASGYLYNAVFTFIILITYLLFKNSGNKKYLLISLLAFISSVVLTQSAWMLTVPFLVFAVDLFLVEKRFDKHTFLRTSPFFIIGLASAVLFFYGAAESRVFHLQTDYGMDLQNATPLLNRMPYSLYMMTHLLIFPLKLALFHEGNVISRPYYMFMILTTISYIALTLYLLKANKRVPAGLMMLMVFSILPVFSPVQIAFFMAERYLYVASAFFCLLLGISIVRLEKKTGWIKLSLVLTLTVTSIYAVRTAVRTNDWQNSKNLWYSNSKVSPNSARIYNNLGDAYAREKDIDRAVNSFEKAIEINPNYTDAVHNLGITYIDAAMYEKAAVQFEKALELDPNYAGAPMAKEFLTAWQQRKQ